MPDQPRTHWAMCLVVCALCVRGVSATVVLPADFTTVAVESTMIVHGRVVSVESHLVGAQRMIESVVSLAVLRSLKGDAAGIVSFRVPAGEVGRYRRILVGAPAFKNGDEIVVFLRGRAPSMPSVFGLNQGLYRVSRDAAARPMVMPPRVTAGEERVVRGDPARVPVAIEVFASEVRSALERAR
jgi:hypothetical protein